MNKLITFTILLIASLLLSKGVVGGLILGLIYGVAEWGYTKFVLKQVPPSIITPIGLGVLAGVLSFVLRLIF